MDLEVSDQTTLGVSFHGGGRVGDGDNASLLLGGFQAGKSVAFPASPDLLQGLAAGMRGPDIPNSTNLIPGTTGLSIPAFGVVLNALATSGKSNVLATPHIIATDNVAADIQCPTRLAAERLGSANLGFCGRRGSLGPAASLGWAAGFAVPARLR